MQANDPMNGRRIGHYRLVKRLGGGGMGTVYLAERVDEFRRQVAIKLVRYAMETPEIVDRFHAERQTMAALSHPNIVALLDGGATDDGLPYLVMEHVEGVPLDEYCATRRLSVDEKLNLFLQICAAVEYAHRHLVVHCDLKPSNILVTADGTPKLLDFGIAKLLGPASPEMTLTSGQRPFTLGYASPEQLLGKPLTTSVDIYALGIVLFELLAGGSPYRLDTHSEAELISAVCYHEAHKPSSAPGARAVARQLEGDLDAIVLKALRKEPERRYGSVEQFAADIRRHLDGLPVGAREGTFRYRAFKFVARNRLGVAAAAAVALAMAMGVAAVAWEGGVAVAARARAERRFNDVRRLAHFLLFDFHDAVLKLPGSTPVQAMLVRRSLEYLDSLATESAGDPDLELDLAEAYVRLGDVQGNPYFKNLGDTIGAMGSYGKALRLADALARSAPGSRRAMRAQARAHQGMSDLFLLRREMGQATAHARQASSLLERLVRADPRDLEARMDLAGSLDGLGDQLVKGLRDRAGAEQSYRKALARWEEALALDARNVRARRASAAVMMKLADFGAEKDTRAAIENYHRALSILGALPPDEQASGATRRIVGSLHRRIADAQWEMGDLKAATETYGQATADLAALAAIDPSDARAQFDLIVVLNNAGALYEAAGDPAAALRNYGQVADSLESLLKTDPENASWRGNLAEILTQIGGLLDQIGQASDARRQTARGLQMARELGDKPRTPAVELIRAARILVLATPRELRDPQPAIRYALRAVELTKGADALALDTLAEAYLAAGNQDAARAAAIKGLALAPAPTLRQELERKKGPAQ
jgi:tetratricopeptide (TPR) repeat protein